MSPIVFCTSKRVRSSVSLPASIFEKSRMSLISESKVWPASKATVRYSRWRGLSSVSSTSSAMPRMAFIGVRISWLMLARKAPFAWFAASTAWI